MKLPFYKTILLICMAVAVAGCVNKVSVLGNEVYGPTDKSLGEEAFDLNKTPGGGDVF